MLTIVPSYTKMEVPLEFLILPHLLSPPSVIGIPMRVPLLKKKKKHQNLKVWKSLVLILANNFFTELSQSNRYSRAVNMLKDVHSLQFLMEQKFCYRLKNSTMFLRMAHDSEFKAVFLQISYFAFKGSFPFGWWSWNSLILWSYAQEGLSRWQ